MRDRAPRHAAQPKIDSAPARSAEYGSGGSSTQGSAGTAGKAPNAGGADGAATGDPAAAAREETAANSLLDGLKIVAQNGEAKDRAERLAVGQAPVVFDTADSPACTDCGSIMVRNGSCYKCINCGATSGCS